MTENDSEFQEKKEEKHWFHCENCDVNFERLSHKNKHDCETTMLALRGIKRKNNASISLGYCCMETAGILIIHWSFVCHFDYSMTYGILSTFGVGLFLNSYYGRKMVKKHSEE